METNLAASNGGMAPLCGHHLTQTSASLLCSQGSGAAQRQRGTLGVCGTLPQLCWQLPFPGSDLPVTLGWQGGRQTRQAAFVWGHQEAKAASDLFFWAREALWS